MLDMGVDGPAPRSRRWAIAGFTGVTAATTAFVGVLAAIDPNEPGHYPTCPFLQWTGGYCPGCGSMRAIHDLAHGDLVGALDRNPLTVVMIPLIIGCWAMWGLRLAGRTRWSTIMIPPRALWVLTIVILAFWGLRNVPGWTWLSPA